jgi:hypothetical protein
MDEGGRVIPVANRILTKGVARGHMMNTTAYPLQLDPLRLFHFGLFFRKNTFLQFSLSKPSTLDISRLARACRPYRSNPAGPLAVAALHLRPRAMNLTR